MPHRYIIAAFPLSGPEVYKALISLYSISLVYAFGSVATGVLSIQIVAGDFYGRLWPLMLLAASTVSLGGVIRSRYTGRVTIEFVGTLTLFAALFGYFVAILWRFWTTGDLHSLPSSLLPVMIAILPFFRLRAILARPHGGPPATPRLDRQHHPVDDPDTVDPEAPVAIAPRAPEQRTHSGIHRPITGEIAIIPARPGAHDAATAG